MQITNNELYEISLRRVILNSNEIISEIKQSIISTILI